MATYLQGRFVKQSAGTIRVSHFRTATSTWYNTDIAFTDQLSFSSVDVLVDYLNTNATGWTFEVVQESGKLKMTPPTTYEATPNVWIVWSHAGTGADLRDFLGESGDVGSTASPYTFTSPHEAGWYPERALTRLDFSRVSVPRSSRMLMDKTAETQWGPDSTSGHSLLDVQLFSSSLAENESLEDFFDDVFTGQGEPFSITNGSDSYSIITEGAPFSLAFRRVSPRLDTLWRIDLQAWSV